ncbi:anti-anti-sigma factor [Amycolatopsis pretoriensis]|uniref:Anti-anti-sigma factor n=1 Tax=Amycolatopsis pretoriensis TaxID=218821 RepID=A0A1H5RE99_9PSEU|nr:STAS domain-containing protein [Amycolatopsis pretoriensis]SEF36364.1 anti-anti-sigma factor [Amycolatopsis pretoriensis]
MLAPQLSPPAVFDVTATAHASVITATGELDLAVTEHLETLLRQELRLAPAALVFDVSAVTFCSARVLSILLDAVAEATLTGVPFAVAGRCRALLRPIAVLHLDDLLPVHSSTEEALLRLAGG